jgi:hypothetical protein
VHKKAKATAIALQPAPYCALCLSHELSKMGMHSPMRFVLDHSAAHLNEILLVSLRFLLLAGSDAE